jgi:hypothetical protein
MAQNPFAANDHQPTLAYYIDRFEVLTAVKMLIVVFWVVTPCSLVGGYQRLGGTYSFHFQGIKWLYVPPKRR